ncbi:MAG TPA: VOC family protein [Candidatus Brocadiia bacterium]|nr:VOC family protein [Candidatus Brocadiia bacterium]
MIKGFAHICFRVRNLDSAIAFYCDKLGLKPAFDFINENGERFGIYIRFGGRNFLELFKAPPQKPGETAAGNEAGYQHMCLEVDDLPATVAALRANGVQVSEPTLGKDQSWQAWLSDPEGNRIELHSYTASSWQAPWLR